MYSDAHILSEQKSGVNLLQIRSQNPGKYALALLDALFSNEEQSTCCYKASTKTNSSSVSQKPPLSPNRVKLLEGTILFILKHVISLMFHLIL